MPPKIYPLIITAEPFNPEPDDLEETLRLPPDDDWREGLESGELEAIWFCSWTLNEGGELDEEPFGSCVVQVVPRTGPMREKLYDDMVLMHTDSAQRYVGSDGSKVEFKYLIDNFETPSESITRRQDP